MKITDLKRAVELAGKRERMIHEARGMLAATQLQMTYVGYDAAEIVAPHDSRTIRGVQLYADLHASARRFYQSWIDEIEHELQLLGAEFERTQLHVFIESPRADE